MPAQKFLAAGFEISDEDQEKERVEAVLKDQAQVFRSRVGAGGLENGSAQALKERILAAFTIDQPLEIALQADPPVLVRPGLPADRSRPLGWGRKVRDMEGPPEEFKSRAVYFAQDAVEVKGQVTLFGRHLGVVQKPPLAAIGQETLIYLGTAEIVEKL